MKQDDVWHMSKVYFGDAGEWLVYSGELPDVWSCSDQYSDDSYPEKEEIARYVSH